MWSEKLWEGHLTLHPKCASQEELGRDLCWTIVASLHTGLPRMARASGAAAQSWP